jgi:hypothetical protein
VLPELIITVLIKEEVSKGDVQASMQAGAADADHDTTYHQPSKHCSSIPLTRTDLSGIKQRRQKRQNRSRAEK